MLGWLRRLSGGERVAPRTEPDFQRLVPTLDLRHGIPTVEFDPRRVTEAIKAKLKKDITKIPEFDASHFGKVYDAALRSILKGRDLGMLASAIVALNLPNMTKGRAGQISRSLHNKATARMGRDQQTSLGVKYATWRYSGVPCLGPSNEDLGHEAVNKKRYEVAKGLHVNGRLTLPGIEEGCKCVSVSIVPGLD